MSQLTPVSRSARTDVRTPEMVPIAHESSARVARTLFFGVPPVALVAAGWMAWGGSLHWHDLVVFAITYVAHRARHHGRLPPAVHPPQLQDEPRRPGAVRRARLDGRRGPADRLGRHPPQAPPLLRPPRRSAQPPRRPRRRAGAARCAASATRTSAGCSAARTWPNPRALRQGPARRPRHALHQPHVPALGGGRARAAVRPRLARSPGRSRAG